MKSLAVTKDHKLEIAEIPMPTPDKCSVLVKTLASGICGTDAKIIHGTFKNVSDYPCLLGHEAVGEVVEVGSAVKQFKAGDKLLVPFIDGCVDGYHSCWGGFSEYAICHDWMAMADCGMGPGTSGFEPFVYTQKAVPQSMDNAAAVMMITLREVLAACHNFRFRAGESIVIYGAGPVGLSFVRFAKLLGLGPVVVVDISDEKFGEAQDMGADYTFNSTTCDLTEKILSICPDGVDYCLDVAGVNSLIMTSMKLIKNNGHILTYGISPKLEMQLGWVDAPYNWNLSFFQFPDKQLEGAVHEQLLSWIDLGLIDPLKFVSHIIPFDNILEGFGIVERRESFKKIVIDYTAK